MARQPLSTVEALSPHFTTGGDVIGEKHDQGKLRYDLIPVVVLREIARALGYGLTKYGENNWQHVPRPEERYYAATMRHLEAWRDGEDADTESGLSHLSHALCSVAFLVWFDHRGKGH